VVSKGQFLERPTLIPTTGGAVMEGVAHRGEKRPGVLIVPPPPQEGSGMDHVVAAELAFALSRLGHGTLRFNFRGVGASQGPRAHSAAELLEDAQAAHQLSVENTLGPPVVVSLGASDAVALELTRTRPVAGLALIAPSLVQPLDLDGTLPTLVVLPELGESDAWKGQNPDRFRVAVIPGADRSFQRNLPLVGRAVADWLLRVGSRAPSLQID
jgi:alpha/beta superfamily hydrolase